MRGIALRGASRLSPHNVIVLNIRLGAGGVASLYSSCRPSSTNAADDVDDFSAPVETSDGPGKTKPRPSVVRRKRLVDPLDEAENEEGMNVEGLDDEPPTLARRPSPSRRVASEDEELPTDPAAAARAVAVKAAAKSALSRASKKSDEAADNDDDVDEGGNPADIAPPAADQAQQDEAQAAAERRQQLEAIAAESSYSDLPTDQLVEAVCAYLRATENVKLVNEDDERQLFPVLILRLEEIPIQLLLAVVASPWTRSTLVRYGTSFKDLVRDHIASKAAELTPEEILDAIVVMGLSAGRRKRDLEFFQMLGSLFAHNINHYRDPHDLVKVLTAFNRAKIIPPDSFLAMIGRRFPILNKKMPMQPLPAFRAFVNLKRMGHEQLNPFRFLADRIMESIQENVKREMIAEKLRQQRQEKDKTSAGGEGNDDHAAGEGDDKAKYVRLAGLKLSQVTKLLYILSLSGAPHQQYMRPLIKPLLAPALPHLPPPSLTRLLKAMARFSTSDKDLILPSIKEVLRRCKEAEASGEMIILQDLLELLNLLRSPESPLLLGPAEDQGSQLFKSLLELVVYVSEHDLRLRPADMIAITASLVAIRDKAVAAAEEAELLSPPKEEEAATPAEAQGEEPAAGAGERQAAAVPPKPDDEIQLLLKRIIGSFAKRMNHLLDLGVLALTHAEILDDICKVHNIIGSPEVDELKASRRRINHEVGDDEYASMIDIDVRETFHKMLIVNNWNTYGTYKPLPGVLQVDFKQALTEVSAETILSAAHLFEQAFPGHMTITLQRALSRAFLRKVSDEGEEVLTEDRLELVLRPAKPLLFSKEALPRFANLLVATPLVRVKESTLVWELVLEKATRLNLSKVQKIAQDNLDTLKNGAGKDAQKKSEER